MIGLLMKLQNPVASSESLFTLRSEPWAGAPLTPVIPAASGTVFSNIGAFNN